MMNKISYRVLKPFGIPGGVAQVGEIRDDIPPGVAEILRWHGKIEPVNVVELEADARDDVPVKLQTPEADRAPLVKRRGRRPKSE
jgi:hypothetical protein